MAKLILASRSPQRKKLFDLLGLPYQIISSDAPEKDKITSSCAQLVKENALIKAAEVARRVKEGIVIGCDTVVYVGGKKLVLKPKDMDDARKNLKLLMSRPHWVYSGLALIDVKSGKTLLDYEKTKLFMKMMTDAEIKKYHARVNPLDKAGGFDIEGLGSVFIKRIEGCYTNVIGLPMAKLRLMLKKMGVSVLVCGLAVIFSGCTTEYNLAKGEQRSYLYGTEKEVNIGSSVAQKILASDDIIVNDEIDANERVQKILDDIIAVCDRKDVIYTIRIIDQKEKEDDEPIINAFALPGGYIFVYQGLLDVIKTDDQLAGVIAHEVAHVTARHGIERLQKAYGAMLVQAASLATESGRMAAGVNLALTSLMMEYSQADEFEADRLGVKYMKLAGYDPTGVLGMLEILNKFDRKKVNPFSYWRTHPHIPERMANARREITGKMDYRDYIQLIGTTSEDDRF